jgi:hypothetical protein
MRVCDMMLFEATHDDYHMVDITMGGHNDANTEVRLAFLCSSTL